MELNITSFVSANQNHMCRFSDSVHNSGLENIDQVTWLYSVLMQRVSYTNVMLEQDRDEE